MYKYIYIYTEEHIYTQTNTRIYIQEQTQSNINQDKELFIKKVYTQGQFKNGLQHKTLINKHKKAQVYVISYNYMYT